MAIYIYMYMCGQTDGQIDTVDIRIDRYMIDSVDMDRYCRYAIDRWMDG